jgi:hypothetical protein
MQGRIDAIELERTDAEKRYEAGKAAAEKLGIEVDAEHTHMTGRIAELGETLKQAQLKRGLKCVRDCLAHVMVRAMATWRSLVAWKAKITQKELITNFESAMDTLEQLREHTNANNANRSARTMQRFLNALCGGKLAASWRIWAIAVAKERDGHAVLTKAMLRVNKAAVAWGLRQWLDVMAWDAEQGYQALQQALRASQMQIKELKETKSARSMQRYLNAICLSRLSLAWQQWTAWKLELDRLGQLLKRRLCKWIQAELMSGWRRWTEMVQAELRAGQKVMWCMARIGTLRQARAMSKWREVVAWASGESLLALSDEIAALKSQCEALEERLQAHERELGVLRPKELELKRSKVFFVFTTLNRLVGDALRLTWARWVALQRAELKSGALLTRCLDQISDGLLVQGMQKWVAQHRSMQRGGGHWKAGAVMKRMMDAWGAGVLGQAWNQWDGALAAMKASARTIMQRMIAAAQGSVSSAWNHWIRTLQTEKRAAERVQRYLVIKARGAVAFSMLQWAKWCRSQAGHSEKEGIKMAIEGIKLELTRKHGVEMKELQSRLALQTDHFERLKQEAGSTVALLKKRILDAQYKLDERELVSAGRQVRAADTEKRLAMALEQLAELRAQSKAQEASWNKAEQEAYIVAAEVEELEQARVRLVVAQHELTSSMAEVGETKLGETKLGECSVLEFPTHHLGSLGSYATTPPRVPR